ncbi:winged helix-turn-helix transcriptional regulator [Streptomyces mirabilis]|uniref:winged helix-turn-helix transcriptional regulator n=1 Tax=Streptomyces mirabilis TaxID=68239 RepID=UPI0036BED925
MSQEELPPGFPANRPMDVLDAACPSRDAFVNLADKWALLMLLSLRLHGTQRFSELQRSVGGISRRMFSQTLHMLERDGLLRRTVDPDQSPPLVLYGLTDLGGEIAEEAHVMCTWTQERAAKIFWARIAYDERTASVRTPDRPS